MFLLLATFGYGEAEADIKHISDITAGSRIERQSLWKVLIFGWKQSGYAGKDDHEGLLVEIIWIFNSPDNYKIEKSIIRGTIYYMLRNFKNFKDRVKLFN